MKYPRHTWGGFTLVEILVVVSIVSLLSAIVYGALGESRMKGRDAKRESDIGQIQLALRLYAEANGNYPSYPDGTKIGVGEAIDGDLVSYLPTVPSDPLNDDTHFYWYDSAFDCGGTIRVVVGAFSMERSGSNFAEVCNTTPYNDVEDTLFSLIPDLLLPQTAEAYSQGTYYSQSGYYNQAGYYSEAGYYAQASYYSEASYYSQAGYYSEVSYYAQGTYYGETSYYAQSYYESSYYTIGTSNAPIEDLIKTPPPGLDLFPFITLVN